MYRVTKLNQLFTCDSYVCDSYYWNYLIGCYYYWYYSYYCYYSYCYCYSNL